MSIAFIIALVIAIPLILFPAALVWYFNIGGIVHAVKASQKARARREAKAGER